MHDRRDTAIVGGQIRIDEDGTTYAARFVSAGGVVTVTSAFGQKAVAHGNNKPEDVACAILRELIILETRQLD